MLGLTAVVAGHHAPVRFAARRAWKRPVAGARPEAEAPERAYS